ncbi:hypothetical protein [Actinomadura decatromicini]|uniref:hypothetical protein n=1 Tax=Actinomadura decatromicini TaxID=2604572 RepID=UPI0016530F4F|nr:hypothetical protein [Actinomadura decatromicini]
MRSISRERARDLRAEARAAHDARVARRAREYWAELAERTVRPPRRRRAAGRDAATAR